MGDSLPQSETNNKQRLTSSAKVFNYFEQKAPSPQPHGCPRNNG
jgi:hypothetical protein